MANTRNKSRKATGKPAKKSGKTPRGKKKKGVSTRAVLSVDQLEWTEKIEVLRFYCLELADWLTGHHTFYSGHVSEDLDILVKSEPSQRPSVLDLKDRFLGKDHPEIKKSFVYETDEKKLAKGAKPLCYELVLYNSIPKKVFDAGEMYGSDFDYYSYRHFYILKLMLDTLNNHFGLFVEALNYSQRHQFHTPLTKDNYHKRSLINLKKVITHLNADRNGHPGIHLPDLFGADPNSAWMSSDLEYIRNSKLYKGKMLHLWTYMYSRKTSEAFSAVVKSIISSKIKESQFELNEIKSTELDDLPVVPNDIQRWLGSMLFRK